MPPHPEITIRDGQVYSSRFDDIYFSRDDGPAESEYVFLEGNALPDRWQGQPYHAIAETGFGTGLNFLVTLRSWLRDPDRCKRLDYYSIEAFPLSDDQLNQVYAGWPEFARLAAQLVTQYPPLDRGVHTLWFAGGRVQLHLLFMTLENALSRVELNPDSWYLDGFAPARNPAMWQADCLQTIAASSRPGTRLATFTAAGEVRRGLETAGFVVNKRQGYGRKREMITAIRDEAPGDRTGTTTAPWFILPDIRHTPEHVVVIGAGIAGAQTAWHLAMRGVRVTVVEAGKEIAREASGNPVGILAPKLTAAPSEGETFYLAAFLYQLRQLGLLESMGKPIEYSTDGLLQLAQDRGGAARLEKLSARDDLPGVLKQVLGANQVSAQLGESVAYAGLLVEAACALSPRSLCRALLEQAGVETRLATEVERIERAGTRFRLSCSRGWQLDADSVVLANGYRASAFCGQLPITPVRGQTSLARLVTKEVSRFAVDHAAYLVRLPGDPERVLFGASYQRGEVDTDLRQHESDACQQSLASCLPERAAQLVSIGPAHAGIRATTGDRWPLVGPCWDEEFYLREYADLGLGRHYKRYPAARYQEGLYVLSGLGSRGLATAGYCANLLVHLMLGTKPPAEKQLLDRLHPARFIIRKLKRGK